MSGDPSGPAPVGPELAHAGNPGGVPIERLVAELPEALADVVAGARWEPVEVAASGRTRWRLERCGRPAMFLDVAPEAGGEAERLRVEGDRLVWLSAVLADPASTVSVPSVLASVADPASGEHYLATSSIAGSPASRFELMVDADALISALATGLRALHDRRPPAHGPSPISIDGLVAQAGERVRRGDVDRGRFQPVHAHLSPGQLHGHLSRMRAALPEPPDDRVVVHGRPTLDNTWVDAGRVAGYVGTGRAGVADRYLDLAVVARELADKVSPHALGPFFAAYGIDAPDLRRLDFYLLVDELL
jgi:aminoglycoside phosphotransferase